MTKAEAVIDLFAAFLRARAGEGGIVHSIDVEKTIRLMRLPGNKMLLDLVTLLVR